MNRLTALLISSVAWFSAASDTNRRPVLVFATGEYAPYVSPSADGYGMYSEIIAAAVAEMGMQAKFEFYPWIRAEKLVASGIVWATFPYGYTQERAANNDFSLSFYETTTVFFYSKKYHPEPISWQNLEDLRPYKIGGVLGYYYTEGFAKSQLNVEYSSAEEHVVHKLRHGRVDLFVADQAVGWELIKQLYPAELAHFGELEKAHDRSGNYLMVSRKYPKSKQLLQRFNQALVTVQRDGTIARIMAKYNMPAHIAPLPSDSPQSDSTQSGSAQSDEAQ